MHTLEVLLQIRSSDLRWWSSNLRDHEKQLFKLIGRRILPTELKEEIQGDMERDQKIKTISGEIVKKKGVLIGEKNLKKIADNKATSTTATGKKRGKQLTKNKGNPKKAKTDQIKTEQQTAVVAGKEETEQKDKRPKLLRETGKWIMGKSIQLCYVMEDIDRTASCSMAFRPMKQIETDTDSMSKDASTPQQKGDDLKNKDVKLIPLATFRSWNKLSKRLNVWVFKFDPDDPTDLSVTEDGGFPRPELLPLSDIFR